MRILVIDKRDTKFALGDISTFILKRAQANPFGKQS